MQSSEIKPFASSNPHTELSLWQAIVFPALAAGMGWGIRGQYGHESGAMIAGALASLTLVLLFVPKSRSLFGVRAAALMTAGVAVGGSMTYGQTVGLTHDRELVGNWEALRWGMLGLAIKGGLWIGFSATFLGIGLSGVRYRFWEMLLVMSALVGAFFWGRWLLNSPFDPANRILPSIYFSDSWYFEPEAVLKPRPEVWGGVLIAWLSLLVYAGAIRRDGLAWRIGLWGFLAGALGFPAGQAIQAYHAWNADAMAASSLAWLYKNFNWWNMMETTFGLVWGGVVGCGLWLNRKRIATNPSSAIALSPAMEASLVVLHLILLVIAEFSNWNSAPALVCYAQYGLVMIVLPVACCVSGRIWPYFLVLPITAVPIIQKSLIQFCYKDEVKLSLTEGWLLIAALPAMVLIYVASDGIVRCFRNKGDTGRFAALGLIAAAWVYLGLNTVFFDFAWPWKTWTARTPNQIFYMTATLVLTLFALKRFPREQNRSQPTE